MAAYTLRLELSDSDYPVTRTVAVPDTASFADLHNIIQSVMQWNDYGYHSFYVGYEYDADGDDDMFALISDYRGKEIVYLYNPDAGWEVHVTWMGTSEDIGSLPVLIDWEGDAPPEGCYDMEDFRRFLAALEDPEGPDFKEYAGIADGWEFDPDTAQSCLRLWGVQGIMPEDAAILDPNVRVDLVMMLSSMDGFPVVFDTDDMMAKYAADPGEIDGDIPQVTPSEVLGNEERFLRVMDDPYGMFTELVDGFLMMRSGSGLAGRAPEDVIQDEVSTDEDEEAWNAFVIGTMSEFVFAWARRNGIYFKVDSSDEGEVF